LDESGLALEDDLALFFDLCRDFGVVEDLYSLRLQEVGVFMVVEQAL
jgi:hypothetical protein